MPVHLTRSSCTLEAWARLMADPEDRRTAAAACTEAVGGKLHGFWYAVGARDGVALRQAPDDVSMAAVAPAIGSGGSVTDLETTVLLGAEDTLAALGTAQGPKHRPSGA